MLEMFSTAYVLRLSSTGFDGRTPDQITVNAHSSSSVAGPGLV
jgi:hypothetical protein